MEVIRKRRSRIDVPSGDLTISAPKPSLKPLQGRGLRFENARLYLVLISAGEVLVGASLFVAVEFAHRLAYYATALSGGFAVAGGVYLALAFISAWNNTLQKPRLAKDLIGNLGLKGTEVLADIDCGTGMVAREAEPNLESGLAIVTVPRLAKAKLLTKYASESSGPRGVVVADPRALPVREGVLDYATAGFGVRNFKGIADRTFVLEEVVRTLKPGGSVAVLVRGNPFEASVLFRDKGMVDIETAKAKGFAPRPANVVVARKLFSMGGNYELAESGQQLTLGEGVEFSYAPVPKILAKNR